MKKHSFLLSDKIKDNHQILNAIEVCKILQSHGFEAYFVGGSVRDIFLFPEQTPKDIDIATSASAEFVKKTFARSLYVGKAFGVCLVSLDNNKNMFEVATFRKEGIYSDKRHPDSIEAGSITDDSNRRDFTVNCLYYEPISKYIIDLHDGISDLQTKLLQTVGDPNARFGEDTLRIIRLFRFAANLDFRIAEQTVAAAKLHAPDLEQISFERICLEIQKIKPGKFLKFCELFCESMPNAIYFTKIEIPKKLSAQNIDKILPFLQKEFHTQYPFFALACFILHTFPYSNINWQVIIGKIKNSSLAKKERNLFEFLDNLVNYRPKSSLDCGNIDNITDNLFIQFGKNFSKFADLSNEEFAALKVILVKIIESSSTNSNINQILNNEPAANSIKNSTANLSTQELYSTYTCSEAYSLLREALTKEVELANYSPSLLGMYGNYLKGKLAVERSLDLDLEIKMLAKKLAAFAL